RNHNPGVVGSNPTAATFSYKYFQDTFRIEQKIAKLAFA
ncbi:MAG: hypothetical protein ACI9S8_002237, partial [Chlamydiales bacterium]